MKPIDFSPSLRMISALLVLCFAVRETMSGRKEGMKLYPFIFTFRRVNLQIIKLLGLALRYPLQSKRVGKFTTALVDQKAKKLPPRRAVPADFELAHFLLSLPLPPPSANPSPSPYSLSVCLRLSAPFCHSCDIVVLQLSSQNLFALLRER